jgi:opacity protein-like surface antigen
MIRAFLIFLSILIIQTRSYAQSVGAGLSFNHQGNGILLTYSKSNTKWHMEAGLRIMYNPFGYYENKKNVLFYKAGHAFNLAQRFGINMAVSRKIISCKNVRIDVMANLLTTWHGMKYHIRRYYSDTVGNRSTFHDINTAQPAISVELTIGPKVEVRISKNISAYGFAGIGLTYMDYSIHRKSLLSGANIEQISHRFPNGGELDWVGLDQLPTMRIGLSYSLH